MATGDDKTGLTLTDVKARFVKAEERLQEASEALGTLDQASSVFQEGAAGLRSASAELQRLSEAGERLVPLLDRNLDLLSAGVDAIRLGDPAAMKRQLEEQAVESRRALESLSAHLSSSSAGLKVAVEAVNGAIEKAVGENAAALKVAVEAVNGAIEKAVGENAELSKQLEARLTASDRRNTILAVVTVGLLLILLGRLFL